MEDRFQFLDLSLIRTAVYVLSSHSSVARTAERRPRSQSDRLCVGGSRFAPEDLPGFRANSMAESDESGRQRNRPHHQDGLWTKVTSVVAAGLSPRMYVIVTLSPGTWLRMAAWS